MKITTNFCGARPRLALPLMVLLWTLAVALIVSALWLGVGIVEIHSEQPRLEARRARLDEQLVAAAPRQPLPPAAEMESLRQRVSALNKFSGMKGWSTLQFFSWLETRLPQNVYLVSLYHKPREGEALLVAESSSAEALTGFLMTLEKELRSAEVLLSKQGARSAPGASAVQFEIRVKWAS